MGQNDEYEVERVLNKKIYEGKTYYELKWVGCDSPTWVEETVCSCDKLIEDYERLIEKQSKDEDEDEWEVRRILKKREKNKKVEYLVEWKNWDGKPEWVDADNCQCINLIAAFENPKLKKLWNFNGTNPRLWLDQEAMLKYMKRYVKRHEFDVNIVRFEDDFPPDEQPAKFKEGLNVGALSYKCHWYLVIVIVNFISVTKRLLIGDPLNTLIGVPNTKVHPVFKRMIDVYPDIPIKPFAMTPMDRSDMCAYYVLAAFERALKLIRQGAKAIPERLFFAHSRPEMIRSKLKPETDGEITVALPVSSAFLDGPQCEFCGKFYDSNKLVDEHIFSKHHKQKSLNCNRASGKLTKSKV